MKTIMILGAGRGQVGLYKAAKAMGHKSVAVSIKGDYPGFALADEIRDQLAGMGITLLDTREGVKWKRN